MKQRFRYKNITISGLPGAGSSTLGKALAHNTGWKYFSGGDFMRAYAIREGLFDEDNHFHHDATVYGEEFDRRVDYEVRRTAEKEKGNVMDAWLSGFMTLGVDSTLRVLVVCSDDAIRVDRVMNRDEVSVTEAKKHIFEREEKNRKKWQRMYENEWSNWVVDEGILPPRATIDFWDPKLYDLVVDTYSNSKEQSLDMVMERLMENSSDKG